MDGGSEDHISMLSDDVVSHILSRLPAKDAMRTSILSKDWINKWTSINNIQLDDRYTSLRGKIRNKSFASFVERVLNATQNSRIKSFRLLCTTKMDPQYLKTCIARVLMRGIENLEIRTCKSEKSTFAEDLINYRSLKQLKLDSNCNLSISLIKDCFPNLKILYLGQSVCLSNQGNPNANKVILSFPVLEELELRYCTWQSVHFVEINAPALIKFVVEDSNNMMWNTYVIKIVGPKLEKFKSCGCFLDNYNFVAPSVSKAVLTNWRQDIPDSRVHAILEAFPALEYLEVSDSIANALTSYVDFYRPCFSRLKQLKFENFFPDEELLIKLLQVTPSVESISLSLYYQEGLKNLPSVNGSRLKVVELVGFRGKPRHFQFAESVLKNVHDLDKLFVFVPYKPWVSKAGVKALLSTFPKSSARATVVVNGPRQQRSDRHIVF